MRASGFVTGTMGLGHFAMTTREPEAALAFFQTLFDARLSDTIEDKLNGVTLELSFLRLNPRHHSVAIAATRGTRMNPLRTAIHHLNLSPRPRASRSSSAGIRSSSTRRPRPAGHPATTPASACGAISPRT